jgi:hypothetical protein
VAGNGYASCASKEVRIKAFCLEGTLAIECNETCTEFKEAFNLTFLLNEDLDYYSNGEIREDSCIFLTDSTYQDYASYGSLFVGFDEEEVGTQFAFLTAQ